METADDSLLKQDEAARQELDKAAQQALESIAQRYEEATSALARQRAQDDHAASASTTPAPPEQASKGPEDLVDQPARQGHHRRS